MSDVPLHLHFLQLLLSVIQEKWLRMGLAIYHVHPEVESYVHYSVLPLSITLSFPSPPDFLSKFPFCLVSKRKNLRNICQCYDRWLPYSQETRIQVGVVEQLQWLRRSRAGLGEAFSCPVSSDNLQATWKDYQIFNYGHRDFSKLCYRFLLFFFGHRFISFMNIGKLYTLFLCYVRNNPYE